MPTIEENRTYWGRGYAWPADGDEWSVGAGGTPWVWHGTIMPRLVGLIPAVGTRRMSGFRILEIAPGHGRFTRCLLDLGARVTGVDLTAECTRHCRARFRRERWRGRARFHTNDGRSLPMIADSSIDLAFSWDSLVHCDPGVMRSYVHELARVLRPGGAALLHHSNLGNFPPDPAHPEGTSRNVEIAKSGWRDGVMTWQLFREFCDEAGLWCLAQEPRTFNQPLMIDCISLARRPTSRAAPAPEPVLHENPEFYRETHNLRRISTMYRLDGAGDH